MCVANRSSMAVWHIQPSILHQVKCTFIAALHCEAKTLLKYVFFFFFWFTEILSWWNHTTFHNRSCTLKQRGKICQHFPNCSCTAIPRPSKDSSIEIPSLRITQDHKHPSATQSYLTIDTSRNNFQIIPPLTLQ